MKSASMLRIECKSVNLLIIKTRLSL